MLVVHGDMHHLCSRRGKTVNILDLLCKFVSWQQQVQFQKKTKTKPETNKGTYWAKNTQFHYRHCCFLLGYTYPFVIFFSKYGRYRHECYRHNERIFLRFLCSTVTFKLLKLLWWMLPRTIVILENCDCSCPTAWLLSFVTLKYYNGTWNAMMEFFL